jgi:hypothetical protein
MKPNLPLCPADKRKSQLKSRRPEQAFRHANFLFKTRQRTHKTDIRFHRLGFAKGCFASASALALIRAPAASPSCAQSWREGHRSAKRQNPRQAAIPTSKKTFGTLGLTKIFYYTPRLHRTVSAVSLEIQKPFGSCLSLATAVPQAEQMEDILAAGRRRVRHNMWPFFGFAAKPACLRDLGRTSCAKRRRAGEAGGAPSLHLFLGRSEIRTWPTAGPGESAQRIES